MSENTTSAGEHPLERELDAWQPIEIVPIDKPVILKKRGSDGEILGFFTILKNGLWKLTTINGSWDGAEKLYKHLYSAWKPKSV